MLRRVGRPLTPRPGFSPGGAREHDLGRPTFGTVTQLARLQRHGIRRLGTQRRGFRFVAPSGKPLRNGALARIHGLKLPPAWSDVYVSPSPRDKVQAVGKDKAGRWQYRYHPEFRARR